MYNINAFLYYNLNDNKEYIIQTSSSILIVKDKDIINLLNYIEINNINFINKKTILEFINNEKYDKVIKFLLENKIFYLETKKSFNLETIYLLSNNKKFNELFIITFSEYFKEIIVLNTDDVEKLENNIENIILVFLNPFKYKEFLKIDNSLKSKNLISKFIIYYNHCIYISNFYKKAWFNPCPKCFFSNLENHLRGSINNNQPTFQLIIDLIYEKKIDFPIECNIENYKLNFILNVIYNQFEKLSKNENYILNEINEISLNDIKVIKDKAYYWEICDCYE